MEEENLFNTVKSVEFYVGSAKHWAYFHQMAMGFRPVGYAGPETGVRDRVSYILEQNGIRLIFTSFLDPRSPIGEHVRLHGDGIKDITMDVPDLDETINGLNRRGVVKVRNLSTLRTDWGKLRTGEVPTYGETVHTLLDLSDYDHNLPPGYQELDASAEPTGLLKFDHIVGNVEEGKMDPWVNYYIKGMGFNQLISFDDKQISTEYSALRSKVVEYGGRRIIFPINEPALGLKKSQIQEYLDYYNSPGVQHIALLTDNIVKTVSELKRRGVEFLYTPDSYYDDLEERVGHIGEDIEKLRELRILVDRDEHGYLLQIFTKPIGDRPTFFYEIIQRKGAQSFGAGNFKALFKSIEEEQRKRGNL
ncbi:4-hydroxyphenylpyruvate dioxygenase [Thermogymnomonas acidicola]|uniref:4-hydroxyphenylpyruvate dioxygenase n=1 Tax=Thermogymnomonas acidicola TaxID=399579 RepID=A0AA37F9I0_9ARCH|nr:4-hydroxyphenylpyruvate dioxygenase [Thermogymnomonas acidicola]GGM74673.1 4-hydroxyphenylpyruvate dioxygenase [Thermogymnomonas acidicola]